MAYILPLFLHHSKCICYGTSSAVINYSTTYSAVGCYTFSEDIFDKIDCTSNYGGAFYISAGSTSILTIVASVFRNCSNTYSQGRGGGFFAVVADACMNQTCFYSCECLYYGQSFYISPISSSGHFFNSTLMSISRCSPDSYGQYSCVHISINTGILTKTNSSYNKVTSYGAGLYNTLVATMTFSYSTIFQTIATSGDTITQSSSGISTTFSFVNIIGNSAAAAYLIEQDGGSLALSSCVFASNKASSFTNIATSSVTVSSSWIDDSSVASAYASGFTLGYTNTQPNAFYLPNKCINLSTNSFTQWHPIFLALSKSLIEIISAQLVIEFEQTF